jgi:hypothetical protein
MHEIIHIVASQAQIELKEREVELLSYGLLGVLRDNDLERLLWETK